jgi:hypothetical protein
LAKLLQVMKQEPYEMVHSEIAQVHLCGTVPV